MIVTIPRPYLNIAILLLAVGLHIASIAAVNYVFSHSGDTSAAMRPLTVQFVTDTRPLPRPQPEAPSNAMNAPAKPPTNGSQTLKHAAGTKLHALTIKTDPTPVPEVSLQKVPRDQQTMQDHINTASARITVAAATSAATSAAKTPVSIPANYAASNRKPDYPKLSQRFAEQGTTVLRVFVQSDGRAGEVQIKKSSGYELLDESARIAISNWRFNPATSDGKAIAEWYEIPIPFRLQD